jgi:hypothetical protein
MKNEDRDQKIKFLQTLLKFTTETPNVDYKSAIAFTEDDSFSLKLVKHIFGNTNSGGGFLIIGFKEDQQNVPQPDPNMNADILGTYETTRLSSFVNSHADGSEKAEIVVWKVDLDGKLYPIIEVMGFKRDPIFCKSTKKDSSGQEVLKDGALYVRDNETKTIQVADAHSWKKIIDESVRLRNNEMLDRFKALLETMTNPKEVKASEEDSSVPKKKWLEQRSNDANELFKKQGFDSERWEVSHWLVDSKQKWDQSQLLEAAQKATLHNTGWPIGLVIYTDTAKPFATNDGITETLSFKDSGPFAPTLDYWYLRNDGTYFFTRNYNEEKGFGKGKRLMYFDIRIWRITEALEHCISLYRALNIDPQSKIHITITHLDIKDRILTAADQMRAFTMLGSRVSGSNETVWEIDATLDELAVKLDEFAEASLRELFVLFDFWKPEPGIIEGIIKAYHISRM